ncbi:hypothetical protein [Micromonospora sp. IBHARD004]|uniref:hypothetical protein n=1 Tax=Micromonospora sp. IBHARD004 TaxID=3457764 RepID=UPI004057DDB2
MGSAHAPDPPRSAEDDADQARWFAISLDDATPERVAAVTAALVKTWQADVDRLAAARAVCRRRDGEGNEDGWRETVEGWKRRTSWSQRTYRSMSARVVDSGCSSWPVHQVRKTRRSDSLCNRVSPRYRPR